MRQTEVSAWSLRSEHEKTRENVRGHSDRKSDTRSRRGRPHMTRDHVPTLPPEELALKIDLSQGRCSRRETNRSTREEDKRNCAAFRRSLYVDFFQDHTCKGAT
jgi:hypothetical protein